MKEFGIYFWAIVLVLFTYSNAAELDRNVIRRAILQKRSLRQFDSAFDEEAAALTNVHSRSRRAAVEEAAFPSDDEDGEYESSGDVPTDDEEPVQRQPLTGDFGWYRTTINFMNSIDYSDSLTDYNTDEFAEVSDEIMIAMEDFIRDDLGGYNEVTPIRYSLEKNDVIAMIDVGMCTVHTLEEVQASIRKMMLSGYIGNFRVMDPQTINMRHIGVDQDRNECLPSTRAPVTAAPVVDTTTKRTTTTAAPRTTTTARATTTRPTTTTTEQTTTTFRPAVSKPTPKDERNCTCDDDEPARKTEAVTARRTSASPPKPSIPCAADQATCSNGQCIDRSYVCDGYQDCEDGSDEPASCAADGKHCDPSEFMCVGTGICAQKTWRCDGDDDCGNGYDERDCPTTSPTSNCPPMHFECDNKKCIPASYQCDKEQDCDDGTDELGCSSPTVIRYPQRMNNVTEGSTVQLFCDAVGTTTPVISWRLNWGNVPPPPRVTMTSAEGKGVLTIRNVGMKDQGAYTCEAMNSEGSVLATPDAIVNVIESDEDCPPGQFNKALPGNEPLCTDCFCFGVTNECEPIHVKVNEIGIDFADGGEDIRVRLRPPGYGDENPPMPVRNTQIHINPASGQLELVDLSKRFMKAAQYWSMPEEFAGYKISSYDGALKYSFSYNRTERLEKQPTNHHDLVFEGRNGQSLFFRNKGPHPEPGRKHEVRVKLNEKNFKTEDGEQAEKEDMLRVLQDLKHVLIRTVYDNTMTNSGIASVKMQTKEEADAEDAGSDIIVQEKCHCPPGYIGNHCETCDVGYDRLANDKCFKPVTCDSLGTDHQTSEGECVCKPGVEGVQCETCSAGHFHLSTVGCIPCYCSGVSSTCDSTTMIRSKIYPDPDNGDMFGLVTNDEDDNLSYPPDDEEEYGRSQSVTISLRQLPSKRVYFWSLGGKFKGDLIKSYGGKLEYTVSYQARRKKNLNDYANVVIKGSNGMSLSHFNTLEFTDSATFDVILSEGNWMDSFGKFATREEIMMVLADVEKFFIRASYASSMTRSVLSQVSLESAEYSDVIGHYAYEVEQCECPPQYAGSSCQDCRDHSMGDMCELCEPGYYRSPGGSCEACPCYGRGEGDVATCHVNQKEEVICDRCPDGYTGARCDSCDEGYVADTSSGQLLCFYDADDTCNCNENGALDGTCDEFGNCKCKEGVDGANCDGCHKGFFSFNVENANGGCLQCFCMGITRECTSSTFQRNQVMPDFRSDFGGFSLIDYYGRNIYTTGFEINNGGRTLTHPNIDDLPQSTYYWSLPEAFLGDKIVSYGGDFRYRLNTQTARGSEPQPLADIIIHGNEITLEAFIEHRNDMYHVAFREQYWQRTDGTPASRQDLLMVLADLERIWLKATPTSKTTRTSVSYVVMETASENELNTEPAVEVEQCICPEGYDGLSCEDCAPGFTRIPGAYLGMCELCNCNRHADSCDSNTGVCQDCKHNTVGDHCEKCAPGFYGDATTQQEDSCKPCECPGTGDNSFSDTCSYDALDDRVVCTNCAEGYAGDHCDKCAPGYVGNPLQEGGKCTPAPENLREPPTVTVTPGRKIVQPGDSVTLKCHVESAGPVSITWRPTSRSRDLAMRMRPLTTGKDSTLVINNFQQSDQGRYVCLARNDHGQGRADASLYARKKGRSWIKVTVQDPTVVRVPAGSDVSLTCTAESHMPAAYIIMWNKETGDFPMHRATDFDGVLNITNVQPGDAGTYVCMGSNMRATDTDTAELIVEG